MSRRKRNKLSADGIKDGRRVLDEFDRIVMHELIATAAIGLVEQILPLQPLLPPRTDAWFVEQEAKKTPPEAIGPDAGQTYVDFVRWRAVRQAHNAGPWRKAHESARDELKAYGRPFAGSKWAMRSSHNAIQRLRKAIRTTK
jgi:hypothetical protein